MLTSLPLQIFVYFGMWWDVAYWLLSVAVFVYKGQYALALQCKAETILPSYVIDSFCVWPLQASCCHTQLQTMLSSSSSSSSTFSWSLLASS